MILFRKWNLISIWRGLLNLHRYEKIVTHYKVCIVYTTHSSYYSITFDSIEKSIWFVFTEFFFPFLWKKIRRNGYNLIKNVVYKNRNRISFLSFYSICKWIRSSISSKNLNTKDIEINIKMHFLFEIENGNHSRGHIEKMQTRSIRWDWYKQLGKCLR